MKREVKQQIGLANLRWLLPIWLLLAAVIQPHLTQAAGIPVQIQHDLQRPNSQQVVTVNVVPEAKVAVSVTMPNGMTLSREGRANTSGTFRWSFVQPAGTLTPFSNQAQVQATIGPEKQIVLTQYSITFSRLDLSVISRYVVSNSSVLAWVHTRPGTVVTLTSTLPGVSPVTKIVLARGPFVWNGWEYVPIPVRNAFSVNRTYSVTATAMIGGAPVRVKRAFKMDFGDLRTWLEHIQLLHQVEGTWVPTTQARVGEEVRLTAVPMIHEPAGDMQECPSTISASIAHQGKVLFSVPGSCPQPNVSLSADVRVTDSTVTGELQLLIGVTYLNAYATYSMPFTLVAP